MIHKNVNGFTLIIRLFVLGVLLTACNLPGAELAEVADQQAVDSLPNDQPFEQASPSEFFQICEDGGGQVEQWGDGWACDFDTDEDITCDAAGDCTFGTVEEPNAPGYTVKSPVLAAEDDPGDFVAACQDAGGAFIEWHAGFGCDFEENVDVFCGPEDGECGLGWVVELTTLVYVQDAAEAPVGSGQNLVMVAPLFQPAFVTEAESGIQADGAQGTFAVSKEVILGDFQQGRPQTDSDGNAVAQDKEGDDNFAGLSVDADNCELTGGSATIEIDPNDDSGNSDVMVCTFPDGGGYACTTSACSPFFEGEQPDGSIDFGNFQDAFVATEVFIVLAGPSNLAPDLLGLDADWNELYDRIVGINWTEGFSNLPGTVSVIGPNNVVFQDDGPGGMLLRPNTDGDPFLEKTCGILTPPLCWPEVGLLIPETNLVYYVEVADLPMPAQFKWVEKLNPTPTEPVFKVSATPVTPVFKASVTPSPTAKNTKVPKPTATPTQVDPMNASISGKVWNDTNGNGSINAGEPGLANATVKLRAGSCGSAVIASKTTGSSGNYSFTGLAAGTYCVTATGSGSITAVTTPDSGAVVLTAGQSKSVKFGFQKVID